LGLIDDAHAARADAAQDPIVGDLSAFEGAHAGAVRHQPDGAMLRRKGDRQRPRFNRTLSMARRGSTNVVGNANVGLNRLSLARASSAVSLSRFSTSSNNSTRPSPNPR